ncbi:Hypothetical protein FKW44_008805, partial [Caligus rogercresseyi]
KPKYSTVDYEEIKEPPVRIEKDSPLPHPPAAVKAPSSFDSELEVLQKLFPNKSLSELSDNLLLFNGNTMSVIQHLLSSAYSSSIRLVNEPPLEHFHPEAAAAANRAFGHHFPPVSRLAYSAHSRYFAAVAAAAS